MAVPQYSSTELVSNIKRRCAVPTSQLTYTDADFVALANDELQGEVVPLIMACRENYFVTHTDIVTTSTGLIDIPTNAVGAKLRNVTYKQQDTPLVLANLPCIDLDIVAGVGFSNLNTLAGFFVEGNSLVLYPTTSVPTGTNMRLYFYERSLVLTDSANFGQIISIDELANTIVLSFLPYQWTTGTQLNALSSLPNFKITSALMTVVSVSSPSVIVDSVAGLSVGDYVSEYGYSAIPQVPVEAHALVAQLTAALALEGLGDKDGAAVARSKADVLKKNLLVMISQRVDGSVKKVMSASGGLRLNAGLGRSGGWGRGWF